MKVCSTGKPLNYLFLSPLMPLVGVLSGGCRGADARMESRGWDFRAANWSGLRSPVQNLTMFSLKEGLTSNTAANTQEGINNHFWPVCNKIVIVISASVMWPDSLTHRLPALLQTPALGMQTRPYSATANPVGGWSWSARPPRPLWPDRARAPPGAAGSPWKWPPRPPTSSPGSAPSGPQNWRSGLTGRRSMFRRWLHTRALVCPDA